MQIRITETPSPENMGKYQKLVVNYDVDGDARKMNLVNFGNDKEIYDIFLSAAEGDAYEVKAKKDGKYWKWTDAARVEGSEVPVLLKGTKKAVSSGTRTGDWETAEERAKKQVYIVRQSSITAAINYFGMINQTATMDAIINTAKEFEAYVFSVNQETKEIE